MSESELSVTLYRNDGSTMRFGPDEADAGDVPVSVEWGTEIPGWGWAEGSVVLKRPSAMSSLDDTLFSKVRIHDNSGQIVYEGRVVGVPRSGSSEIELDLEGPLAALDDNATARMIYRDVDLGNWQGMSTQRKFAILTSGTVKGIGDGSTGYDTTTGNPSLELQAGDAWVSNYGPLIESWYDGGPGLTITKIVGNWTRSAITTAANFSWDVGVADDDLGTNFAGSGDLQSEPTATAAFTLSPSTARRWGVLRFYWDTTAAGSDGAVFLVSFRNIAVYGSHGLTIRGTEPSAGFYASDVVTDALSRWAPLIDIATGGIESSTFIIPHLVFREDTTARAIIEAVSLFGANGFTPPDWGYYEDGFFWKTPGTYGRTWRVRRDQAVIPLDEGPSTETRCNGFKVSYQDAAGQTKTVGPPGSNSDTTSTDLQDTSPTNPVNAAGIPYRIGSRDVGITTLEGATLIGRLLLREANEKVRKGSVQIVGVANDEAGNEYPAYLVRAGDYVVIEDDEDTTPRKIVSTQFSGRTVTCSLDNSANRIESLLQRLAVANTTAGF